MALLGEHAVYRQHHPEKNVLYKVVEEHLESALQEARSRTEHGLGYPRFVEQRGVCPSCEGRRMVDTAAHLVDRVLPPGPYRQWVLSLPIPIRLKLLRDPALVSAVLRIFARRVFAWQCRVARGMGISDGRGAAVTLTALRAFRPSGWRLDKCSLRSRVEFIQRGGGALNVNVPRLIFQATRLWRMVSSTCVMTVHLRSHGLRRYINS